MSPVTIVTPAEAAATPRSRSGLLNGRGPLTYAPDWQLPGGSVPSINYTTAADSGTFRERFTAKQRFSNPRACFAGFEHVNGDLANAYTIAACALEIGGASIPVTFNGGDRSVVVQPGAWVESDPAGVTIADAATAYWRTHVTVASVGLRLPLGKLVVSASGEAHNLGTGVTNRAYDTGTTNLGTTTGSLFGPVCTLGDPDAGTTNPVIGVMGDSNADRGDGQSTLNYIQELCRQLDYPIINLGRYGEGVVDVVSAATAYSTIRVRRQALIADMTHCIVHYGSNDRRSSGRSASQTLADLLTLANYLARQSVKVLMATQPPESTSGDGWTTDTQTATATEAVRLTTNAGVRAHFAPVYAVLDVADALETARDSGKWKHPSGVAQTSDGVHINAAGAVTVANALIAAGFAATVTATDDAPSPTA